MAFFRSAFVVPFVALTLLFTSLAPRANAEFDISIRIGPPALPVYVQPACPTAGYVWTPGYWAYGPMGYFWVPGVWVAPARPGFLWTPGYWGFGNGLYAWHAGYWGPHVGFYGGINYGFGYPGTGFYGGRWVGSQYHYNTAITNVNTTVVRNVYVDRTVVRNYNERNVSFNGPGGIQSRPTAQEQAFVRESHVQATPVQVSHQDFARGDRNQLASTNQGRPATTAMEQINGRRFNQQGRIANGISQGQLTPGESGRLERREAGVNHEIRNDRTANGGALTPQERQRINQQQNNISRGIANDRHNQAEPHYGNNNVDRRAENQQGRIAQGVRDGQVNAGEAARAEQRQQQVHREVQADRATNGGRLSPEEHRAVEHQQNQNSREIHEERHNGREAPGPR